MRVAAEMRGERTLKPYVHLMQTARLHLEYAEGNEGGSFLNSLSCLLLSALMIEGFMNHAGTKLVPGWPSRDQERKEYLNPPKKLARLLAHAELKPDATARPYSTFPELFEFRNTIAHARTEVISYRGPVLPDYQLWGSHPQTEWEQRCVPAVARAYFEDAQAICRDIWRGLGQESDPFFSAGHAVLGVDGSRD